MYQLQLCPFLYKLPGPMDAVSVNRDCWSSEQNVGKRGSVNSRMTRSLYCYSLTHGSLFSSPWNSRFSYYSCSGGVRCYVLTLLGISFPLKVLWLLEISSFHIFQLPQWYSSLGGDFPHGRSSWEENSTATWRAQDLALGQAPHSSLVPSVILVYNGTELYDYWMRPLREHCEIIMNIKFLSTSVSSFSKNVFSFFCICVFSALVFERKLQTL